VTLWQQRPVSLLSIVFLWQFMALTFAILLTRAWLSNEFMGFATDWGVLDHHLRHSPVSTRLVLFARSHGVWLFLVPAAWLATYVYRRLARPPAAPRLPLVEWAGLAVAVLMTILSYAIVRHAFRLTNEAIVS